MAWCWQQQAFPGANFDLDLCHHMASLGHNELLGFWDHSGDIDCARYK